MVMDKFREELSKRLLEDYQIDDGEEIKNIDNIAETFVEISNYSNEIINKLSNIKEEDIDLISFIPEVLETLGNLQDMNATLDLAVYDKKDREKKYMDKFRKSLAQELQGQHKQIENDKISNMKCCNEPIEDLEDIKHQFEQVSNMSNEIINKLDTIEMNDINLLDFGLILLEVRCDLNYVLETLEEV